VGPRAGLFRLAPEVRQTVSFERSNLLEVPASPAGRIDLLLCRNVLIYFRPETRAKVLEALCSHVADGGFFFVGHAETMHGVSRDVRTVIPTAYQVVRCARS
jgi:chemotaxis protein methyltransferase CheR